MPHIYIAPFICQSTSVPITSFNPHNSLVLPRGNRGGGWPRAASYPLSWRARLPLPALSTVPGLTASGTALWWLLNHRESASSCRTDYFLFSCPQGSTLRVEQVLGKYLLGSSLAQTTCLSARGTRVLVSALTVDHSEFNLH